MGLIGASHKYAHRHALAHTYTYAHSQPDLFKCFPDSMWSSDRTALPLLVVRSWLRDQSGEVMHTEGEKISVLYDAPEPGLKNVVFSALSGLMLLANVVDIFFIFWLCVVWVCVLQLKSFPELSSDSGFPFLSVYLHLAVLVSITFRFYNKTSPC